VDKMWYIVYMITNLLNGMIYVGKHSTTTPYNMKKYWSHNIPLTNARKKHGNKNFKRETLFVFETEDEAYQKEAEIVDEAFVARKDTYNLMVGGCGFGSGETHSFYGKHHSPETKQLQSQIKLDYFKTSKGIKQKENHKEIIGNKSQEFWDSPEGLKERKVRSEKMQGENHFQYGIPRSEETKKKIRDNQPDRNGKNHPMFGKQHTEESNQKNRESHGLTPKVMKQRILDVEVEQKTRGYQARLAKRWGTSAACVSWFILKFAPHSILSWSLVVKQRRQDIKNEPKGGNFQERFSKKWGISRSGVSLFIAKYAQDLVTDEP